MKKEQINNVIRIGPGPDKLRWESLSVYRVFLHPAGLSPFRMYVFCSGRYLFVNNISSPQALNQYLCHSIELSWR